MAHFRTPLKIDAKADESPVTRADRETEAHIRAALGREFPGHGILGEEYGISGSLDGDTWVIDPIDGTRSFITGNPLFGLLMAFLSGGAPRLGLVHMPALGETYVGGPGLGAARNGEAIRCREEGKSETILFNLCGHGHFDMQAYMDYFGGKLQDLDYDEADLAMALAGLPTEAAA